MPYLHPLSRKTPGDISMYANTDVLLDRLSKAGVGCYMYIGNHYSGALCYADDFNSYLAPRGII